MVLDCSYVPGSGPNCARVAAAENRLDVEVKPTPAAAGLRNAGLRGKKDKQNWVNHTCRQGQMKIKTKMKTTKMVCLLVVVATVHWCRCPNVVRAWSWFRGHFGFKIKSSFRTAKKL